MSNSSLVTYDEVPYVSGPFSQTVPCHLALLPVLFGLPVPSIRGGRVLELGCASGGNIVAMAQDLPETEFIGVDLSARQIADGQKLLAEVPLENIELRHQSILDIDDSWGKFDFIICHGVYSWVPRVVQDKILDIAARNMQPAGLCYVSYNTFPGWHLRAVVRDMMRYHVTRFDDPETKIQQARALLAFLAKKCVPRNEAYRQLLAEEAAILEGAADFYLFHEHLEDVNEALYFHEFVERVHEVGLTYLGDTDFRSMLTEHFDSETAALLRGVPLLEQEQYMDFLRNRTFRSSVLCHGDVTVDLNVAPQRLAACSVMLADRVEGDQAIDSSAEHIRLKIGASEITVSHPITKMALTILNREWPGYLPFDELVNQVVRSVEAGGGVIQTEAPRDMLARDVMTLWVQGLLRAQVDPPSVANKPGNSPSVTALVRAQARVGNVVVNRHHKSVQVDEMTRSLLCKLDGEHSREALLAWLAEAFARGEFRVRKGDTQITDVDDQLISEVLNGALQAAADHSLLIQ